MAKESRPGLPQPNQKKRTREEIRFRLNCKTENSSLQYRKKDGEESENKRVEKAKIQLVAAYVDWEV